jgi:uridylate kinase
VDSLAGEIRDAASTGAGIGVVLGGGNILRGADLDLPSVRRPIRDRMGMLATIVNALALGDALRSAGQPASVFTATHMPGIAEPFRMEVVRERLNDGHVVLLSGGTGHPFLTTDTAAALRTLEIGADALLKATKVDGVYSDDPVENPKAVRYDTLTYDRVVELDLKVMDLTAVVLLRDHGIPIRVFNMGVAGNMRRVISGEPIGTSVVREADGGA